MHGCAWSGPCAGCSCMCGTGLQLPVTRGWGCTCGCPMEPRRSVRTRELLVSTWLKDITLRHDLYIHARCHLPLACLADILTNADKEHAERCLARMGLSDCFQGMFYFENVMELAAANGFDTAHAVLCKPNPRVYTLVCEVLGVSPSEVLFFDDSSRNVAGAHGLGAKTVLVGTDKPCPGADLAIPSMHHLPAAMPQLMDTPGLVHEASHHGAQSGPGLPDAMSAGPSGSAAGTAISVPA